MPRVLCAFLLSCLLAACGDRPAPPADPPPEPAPAGRLRGEAVDVERMMAHIRVLADLGPRPGGSEAEARAAGYIEKAGTGLGYRAVRQAVPLAGGASANVVLLPADPAFDPAEERHLLVGAHYDSVPGSPGANDNASGVAVMLEVARALSLEPPGMPVVFVAFGAEEGGPRDPRIAGSLRYVEQMSPRERRNVLGMINLDMVGHGDVLLPTLRINMKRGLHRRLIEQAARMGVPVRENFTPQISDSVPFASQGIETAWLWTGVEPSYHSPLDTPEKVTPVSLDRAGRLTLAVIRSFED